MDRYTSAGNGSGSRDGRTDDGDGGHNDGGSVGARSSPPPPPSSQRPQPQLPPQLQAVGVDSTEAMIQSATESCVFKAAMAAVAGGGLGVAMGLFIGGFSVELDHAVERQLPWREQLRVYGRALGAQMRTYSKNFALWGTTYTLAECSIEKYRARHDLWNSTAAGCVTGAVLAAQPRVSMDARSRANQMAVGCVGMAMFSTAIDYFLEHRES